MWVAWNHVVACRTVGLMATLEEENRLWDAGHETCADAPLRINNPLKCLVSTSSIVRLLIAALVTRQALLGLTSESRLGRFVSNAP